MSLEAIKYNGEQLSILNQLLLPSESVYEEVVTLEDAWNAIRKMKVRGAPAIAIVGTLSVALQLRSKVFEDSNNLLEYVKSSYQYLLTARPTAVNIAEAASRFSQFVSDRLDEVEVEELKGTLIKAMEAMLDEDVAVNRKIGDYGASEIAGTIGDAKAIVLTHCNTGSLATAGYGTALGVIRSLHNMKKLGMVYCTETRPYNQGARLTAYELVYENIPATLVCDSMCSLLMKERKITAVVVGADRVVSNGDTANKIGTYQLAIVAKHHDVPFYVASPLSTIDFNLDSGEQIKIEERPSDEMFHVGGKRIAAEGIGCWNPAFDMTPADLITGGIITEHGVFQTGSLSCLKTK